MSIYKDSVDKDIQKKYFGANAPKNCVETDAIIKKIRDEVVEARQKWMNDYYILKLEDTRLKYEKEFASKFCYQEIENQQLDESGKLLTDYATIQEKDVINKNKIEQNIYIAIGTVTFLTFLYILLKKKK